MSLGRIVFMKRKLREKFGVVGTVAGRYVEAGYSVRVGFETPKGRVDIVAKKEGQILVIDVVDGKVEVGPETIEAIAEKASTINGKPVLILYGSGPRLRQDAVERARERNVEIKRVRP